MELNLQLMEDALIRKVAQLEQEFEDLKKFRDERKKEFEIASENAEAVRQMIIQINTLIPHVTGVKNALEVKRG